MRHTLFSRGRPMGEATFTEMLPLEGTRCGWFLPNDDGERLMHTISANSLAMRSMLHHNTFDMHGNRIVPPGMLHETMLADMAEIAQHLSALELELRRDDGTIVPTADIGLQDTVLLRQLAQSVDPDDDLPDDAELDAQVEEDLQLLSAGWNESDPALPEWDAPTLPEDEARERYQIIVMFPDGVPDQ